MEGCYEGGAGCGFVWEPIIRASPGRLPDGASRVGLIPIRIDSRAFPFSPMTFLRTLSLVLLSFFLCHSSHAQSFSPSNGDRSRVTGVGRLNFAVGVPTGSFQDNIQNPGFGGNVFGGARFGDAPFVLGVDLGILVYDRTTDTVPFSSTVGPRVMVEVVTTNSILEPHLVLRLQPSDGRVRPYVDGLFGFKYLVTETSVRDEDRSDDEEEIASTTNFSDVAVSGGGGAGVDIRLHRGAPEDDVTALSLHLGVQYLVGGRAEYLAGGAIEDQNDDGELTDDELDVRRSTTTLIQPQIGVTLEF